MFLKKQDAESAFQHQKSSLLICGSFLHLKHYLTKLIVLKPPIEHLPFFTNAFRSLFIFTSSTFLFLLNKKFTHTILWCSSCVCRSISDERLVTGWVLMNYIKYWLSSQKNERKTRVLTILTLIRRFIIFINSYPNRTNRIVHYASLLVHN